MHQSLCLLLQLIAVASSLSGFDRADEDCEACGLVFWRMQTIVAEKEKALSSIKAAKEKRAKKSTKAHSKRWLRQEYAVDLAAAIESQIEQLPNDQRIISGACRAESEAIAGSALRAAAGVGHFHPGRCQSTVKARISSVASDLQDDLTSAAVAGKRGAGEACAAIVDGCSAERAVHLLGSQYRATGMSERQLEMLQIGYSDVYTLHEDVDGSIYWFSRSLMKSVKEPPPGWAKGADGKWRNEGGAVRAARAYGSDPDVMDGAEGSKEEL